MDTTGLRTLNAILPLYHLRSKISLSRPFLSPQIYNKRTLYSSSSICSSSIPNPLSTEGSKWKEVNELPNGVLEPLNGESLPSSSQNKKFLQVVLVSPQIPGNTGCIARTCAASSVGLHLVEPLGFKVDSTKLKRAGLDYWPYVVVKIHNSWSEFRDYFRQQKGQKRLLAFTKRGTSIHSDFSYKQGDWLVFGSETSGLPPEVLLDCDREGSGGAALRIPMVDTYVRCLNLSVSVGIALYEASRQLNYEQLQYTSETSETCIDSPAPFITEDIFA